jgi:hypothetical protein
MMIRTLVAAGLVFATGAAARADVVLAQYGFTGASPASTDTDANSTAGNVTLHDATLGHNGESGSHADSGFSGAGNNLFVYSLAVGTTEANALADDDYFTFTISAVAGKVLNLTSLAVDLGGQTDASQIPGPGFDPTLWVQESVDGTGSPSDVLGSATANVNYGGTNFPVVGHAIDLTAARFQNLTSITFTFSLSDNLRDTASINRIDNLVLKGTTGDPVVTEIPTPAAMRAGLALLGLAGLSRRRQTSASL